MSEQLKRLFILQKKKLGHFFLLFKNNNMLKALKFLIVFLKKKVYYFSKNFNFKQSLNDALFFRQIEIKFNIRNV
jgi:hypothetical protein